MTILAAFLLGLLTGARTFMALALVSGYALFLSPDTLIAPFAWLGEWWAFLPLAILAGLELWGDKQPRTPSRTQTGGLLARLISASVAGAAIGGLLPAMAGILGAAAGTYGCAYLRGWLASRFDSDFKAALTEDALAITGPLAVLVLIV
ncbi:DUF4126 domain-containing protein [Oceanicaulis sp. LC35]|uniref:DUF4126 domain-containing protein n=1 Tax=Oceanicaulis sp. LC35 TaxID=3349635 RepID=UPI003F84FE6E